MGWGLHPSSQRTSLPSDPKNGVDRGPVRLVYFDAPSQYEVTASTQCDEERAENDEVDVEVRVLDVELPQYVVWLVEQTLSRIVEVAVERLTVEPVDRLQHALERVPTRQTNHNITIIYHLAPWAPGGMGRGGTCPPWKIYRPDSLQLQRFGSHEKEPKSLPRDTLHRLKIYLNCDILTQLNQKFFNLNKISEVTCVHILS